MFPDPKAPERSPITPAEYSHQHLIAQLLVVFFDAHGLNFGHTATNGWTRHGALLDDHGQLLEVSLCDGNNLTNLASDFENVAAQHVGRLGRLEISLNDLGVKFSLNHDDHLWQLVTNPLASSSPMAPLVIDLGLDKLMIGSINQGKMLGFLVTVIEHFRPESG